MARPNTSLMISGVRIMTANPMPTLRKIQNIYRHSNCRYFQEDRVGLLGGTDINTSLVHRGVSKKIPFSMNRIRAIMLHLTPQKNLYRIASTSRRLYETPNTERHNGTV